MLRALKDKGNDVTLVTTGSFFLRNKYINTHKLKCIYLPSIEIKYLKRITFVFAILIYSLKFLIEKKEIVIVTQYKWSIAFAALAMFKKILNKKLLIIADIRSIPVEKAENKKNIFLMLLSIYLINKLFDGCSVITESTKEYLELNYKLKHKNICIWESAVDVDFFDNSRFERKFNGFF